MNALFADTHYFLALLHKGDADHLRATALAERITKPIITTEWVLTEAGDALAAVNFRLLFVQFVESLRADLACTIVPASGELFDAGLRLYAQRSDKDWSLTDCISFAVMHEYALAEALTGDHHFRQAGFITLILTDPLFKQSPGRAPLGPTKQVRAARLIAQSIFPISWSSVLMHHGGDEDSIMLIFVKDCERKAQNDPLTDGAAHEWPGLRELFDSLDCLFDCS